MCNDILWTYTHTDARMCVWELKNFLVKYVNAVKANAEILFQNMK